MERFKREKVLGKGAFGIVYKVRDVNNPMVHLACKMIPNSNRKQALLEINYLKRMSKNSHSTTIEYIDDFTTANHIVIITEQLGISLLDILRKSNFTGFKLNAIKNVMDCTFSGLGWIHDQNIIHCDIKPENILLDYESLQLYLDNGFENWLHFKLIDFGSSTNPNHLSHSYIQSRFYRAPEVMIGARYDFKMDIWSAACVMMECLTGKPLFDVQDEWQLLDRCIGLIPPSNSNAFLDPFKQVDSVIKKLKWELDVYGGVPDDPMSPEGDSHFQSRIPKSPEKKMGSFSRQSNINSSRMSINGNGTSRSSTLGQLNSISRSSTMTFDTRSKRRSFIPVLSRDNNNISNNLNKASIQKSTSYSSLAIKLKPNRVSTTRKYHRKKARINRNTIIFKAFTSSGTLNYPYLYHKRPNLNFHLNSWSLESFIIGTEARPTSKRETNNNKVGEMVMAFENVKLNKEDESKSSKFNSLKNPKIEFELYNFIKVVEICLVWDKWNRPTAFEILNLDFFKTDL